MPRSTLTHSLVHSRIQNTKEHKSSNAQSLSPLPTSDGFDEHPDDRTTRQDRQNFHEMFYVDCGHP